MRDWATRACMRRKLTLAKMERFSSGGPTTDLIAIQNGQPVPSGARSKVEKREAGKFFIFFVTSASLNHD
jgi:hypothetical protein